MFRPRSIRNKLVLALFGAALLAFAVASLALALFESLTLERRARQVMEPYAQLVSVGAEAAVAFADTGRAQEILNTLRANPEILEAEIVLVDGRLLATYSRSNATIRPHPLKPDGVYLNHDTAELTQSLQEAAHLHLVMSLDQLHRQTRDVLQIFGGGVLVLLAIVLGLLAVLQRTIVRPISTLAKTVEQVRIRADYHQRVPASGTDEVARLGQSFNAMMGAIQERDYDLSHLTLFQRTLLDNVAYGIVSTAPNGIVTSFNPAAERLLGYTASEVVGKLTPACWHDKEEIARRALQLSAELGEAISPGFEVFEARPRRNLPEENEWTFIRKDGTRVPVLVSVTALRGESGQITGFVSLTYDLTYRKRAEKDLAERVMLAELSADIGYSLTKQGDLRSTLNACAEALVRHLDVAFARIWTLNAAENVLELQASAGMYTRIDGSRSRVPVGKSRIGQIAEERKPHVTNAVIGDPSIHDQEWARREGMVAFAGHPLTIEEKLLGAMAMFSRNPLTDITLKALASVSTEIALGIERKLAEEALHRLNRELRAISNCHQILMRAVDEETLLNDICRIVCDEAGYRMAWVGYAENDEAKTVRPVAWAGAEDGYLAGANITWADKECGSGPSGTAIRSRKSACIQDFTADPHAAPWRDSALQRGYRSSLALPLEDESNNAFGVLNIYSTEPNAFTSAEIRLLEELSGDLAFGIMVLRARIERRQAEEALREGEAFLYTLLNAIPIPVFYKDRDGRYLGVNRAYETFFGATRERLVGKTVFDTGPRELAEIYRAKDTELFESGGVQQYESQVANVHGVLREVIFNKAVFTDSQGTIIGLIGAILDITERKRAERALVESYSLLNAVVEGASDAVFVKDRDGRYLMMNSAGARFLGKPVKEVIGKDDRELYAPDTARAFMERDRQVMAAGESQMLEETATAAGATRTYFSTKSAYRDAQGKVIGLIGISRDVTELKRLEEQFRQAQKMESVGRLAGGVAHDFNNLLTVINGYSEMIFSQLSDGDPNREPLAEIRAAGERAANLTRQLLAFSRKQVLQPRVVNLNTLLGELHKLLQRLIGENIELTVVPGDDLGLVRVDPGQFEQAIINLAVNARDAMPQGGQLRIETKNAELNADYSEYRQDVRPGRYVLVTVSDSGQGIDQATKARIFEPFFTTKELGKGTGLGLAMVYGFVRQSGGHIEVHSEAGHGTTLEVYLPRAEETVISAESSRDLPKTPTDAKTILLVEDEDAVRTLSKLVLESSGHTVLEARDGQEAVGIAQRHQGPIHILVTDVVMPGMSGRQLADLLMLARPDVRILLMSGYTGEAMLSHGELEPSVAFLQKPFNPTDLARKVSEVLGV